MGREERISGGDWHMQRPCDRRKDGGGGGRKAVRLKQRE
jgi:hypothetical protein